MEISYILIFILATIITGLAQVILKKAVSLEIIVHKYGLIIIGYFMLFCTTLLTVYSLKRITMGFATALYPLSFIFTMLFSILFLHEHISKNKIIGFAVIVIGILIFSN